MNTIKKTIYTLFIVVALITGCNDNLDISPKDAVTENLAVSDEASIQALLIGAYDRLSDDDLYGGWIQMSADLLGTNYDINWSGTFFAPRDIWQKVMTANNGQAAETWAKAYETINIANVVLANLNVVKDPVNRDRIEGEARFIRGTVYFELIRLYAKDWFDGDPNTNRGVPLKLTPTNLVYVPAEHFIGRSSVANVYNQILIDLNSAESLLPTDNGFFATVWAAKAMLGRVHLQRREYNEARIKANEVIESGPFQLTDRIDRAFNQANNTNEDIFSIQVTNQDGVNALQTFYASRQFNGRRDIRIRAEHRLLYAPSDMRGPAMMIYFDGSGRYLSAKYMDQFANISIVRLAEMYLIRAEGNLLAGGQVGPNTPGDDLNILRLRANAPPAPLIPTINDVMLERKLELSFEGHYIHDIRRREMVIAQNGTFPWNSDALVFPIPQRELDANPTLKGQQNPGY